MIAPATKEKKTKRMRGRRRAEVVKTPVIEGPVSGRPPKLSVGTKLLRIFRGCRVQVTVVENGFEHDGTVYHSLSAAACAISKQHVSGPRWFGLVKPVAKKSKVKS